MEPDFSRPGKPTENAFIEAFNGQFRQESLNENWFLSLEDPAEKVGFWQRHYMSRAARRCTAAVSLFRINVRLSGR